MFEELSGLIKQVSQQAVVENPEIPNEYNNAVMEQAGSSLLGTLQNMMANGQAHEVMGLFGNNAANIDNSPVTQQVQTSFMDSISQKLGISPKVAGAIAAIVIPMLIKKFINRTNDPNDNGFNIQDIFNKLSGGTTSGLNLPNILSQFTGGQAQAQGNPAGGLGSLTDLIGAFTGGSQQPQQQQSGGGLLDQLSGFFGR